MSLCLIHDDKCLNSNISCTGITTTDMKEYKKQFYNQNKEQNKEQILTHNKKYYDENKEQILEYNKQYHEENKEQISERKRNYYDKNREQILERKKNYYDKNKEQIKEKYNIEIKCCCGIIYKGCNYRKAHERTKKHQAWLNNEKMTAETI